MQSSEILSHLAENQAVLTGHHFVYTSGKHGPAYIDMRRIGHQTDFLRQLGFEFSKRLSTYRPDIVVGPETLGRTLATHTAIELGDLPAIWCDIVDSESGEKKAVFSEKMNFQRLLPGKRILIVDDLLTTGQSLRLTAEAIREFDVEVILAGAVVRRTPDVIAADCTVPKLEVLADVEGFELFTEEECKVSGPCSRLVPVVLRPGHGWKWQESNPDYAGGFINLAV
jgi:orotate phosphoribosyltransferase